MVESLLCLYNLIGTAHRIQLHDFPLVVKRIVYQLRRGDANVSEVVEISITGNINTHCEIL